MSENQAISRTTKLREWVNSRANVDDLIDSALHVTIPAGVRTYFLGGLTLFFLGVQVVTGVLLTLYYRPSPDGAYQSVLYIMNEVRFGWLIRSIHAWSANLMVLSCVLHLLRVFVQGAYKKPREMTWIVGVVLLLITLGFGFTGYLLPWDQRAYWATTVGTEIAGAVPVIGDALLHFLRAGDDLSGLTLSRFYGIHTLILPLSIVIFVGIHLALIHMQGLAPPPDSDLEASPEEADQHEQ
jgi:quinol-cytochrome oxidoreductase complex cytochrome b subunit